MSSNYIDPKCNKGYNLVKSKCKCKKIEKRIKKSNRPYLVVRTYIKGNSNCKKRAT